MGGPELHCTKGAGEIGPELKQCKADENHGNDGFHYAAVAAGAAVRILFLHERLRASVSLLDLLFLGGQCIGLRFFSRACLRL